MPIEKELIPFETTLTEKEIITQINAYRFRFSRLNPHKSGKVLIHKSNSQKEYETIYSLQLKDGICKVRLNLNHLPMIDQSTLSDVHGGILIKPCEDFIEFLQENL